MIFTDLFDLFIIVYPCFVDNKSDETLESLSRPQSRDGDKTGETLPTVIEGGGEMLLANLRKTSSIQSLMTGKYINIAYLCDY